MLTKINNHAYSAQKSYLNPTFEAKRIPLRIAKKYKNRILNPHIKTVNIISHASPDDDTRCANEVLANWCRRYGKKVETCINEYKARNLFVGQSAYDLKKNFEVSDIGIAVDFSSESKIPKSFIGLVKKYTKKNLIGFDHHKKLKDMLSGKLYIDKTAKSCCGVIYRFFQSLGEKLEYKDYEMLYCGMLSDFKKSELINIKDGKLTKLSKLKKDKNSLEVFEELDSKLNEQSKAKIYKYLDVLSNLTANEKRFMENLYNSVKVTPNGKLAYIVIDPSDSEWKSMGMDNQRTGEILRNIRKTILFKHNTTPYLKTKVKEKLKLIDGIIIFYRSSGVYQMSINTNPEKIDATKLIKNAQKIWDKDNYSGIKMVGGGHEDRAGSRIFSIFGQDAKFFVNSFIQASEENNAPNKYKLLDALKKYLSKN